MNKKFISLLLVLIVALSLVTPVLALTEVAEIDEEAEAAATEAEEFRYYYRIYNGQNQMRIWSITRGVWVTEWTNC